MTAMCSFWTAVNCFISGTAKTQTEYKEVPLTASFASSAVFVVVVGM